MIGILLLLLGICRIRRHLKPGQDQAEFADTLQLASDEDEAHLLLQRHLQRTLVATGVVVLNRNNSADRLEAVTPLPGSSPLAEALRGAEPRSCFAVRSGRTHRENGGRRPALLSCPVCASCPGASSCVPLIVGGEVIGSVLLNLTSYPRNAEEQQIRESVGQAAPVLANLRNLAVAEIRAATDGLTGLPNKRAATDMLKPDFRSGLDDRVATRAPSPRPRPLQANQRPGRASRGGPGPGQRRRGAAERAAIGTLPAAMAGRSSRSSSPTPRSPLRSRSPSVSVRRSPGSPCRAPTFRSRSLSVSPAFRTRQARWTGSSDSPTRRFYLAKRQGRNRVELAEPTRRSDATADLPRRRRTAPVGDRVSAATETPPKR